jgi:ABC-type uncharacterized transport system permease subunit
MSASLVQDALQLAGFACVTVAAALCARALLVRSFLDPRILRWTRAGFLLLSGALVAGAWFQDPRQQWGLLSWLVFFAVLHVHRVKEFKGRTAVVAGLAGWALAAGAWIGLR